MRRSTRGVDPRWLAVKFPCTCARCKAPLAVGARAFYYPNDRRMLCEADACGGQASRDFDAARFDEAQAGGLL